MADETDKGSGTTQEAKLGFEPKTSYVPGYPPGDKEGDRDEILFNQLNRDLSIAARKTLGNFLSDVTSGKRQSPSSNAFRSSDGTSELELYDRGTGLPADLISTTRLDSSDTVKEYEETGATLGAFLDLVEGYDVDAAAKFDVISQGDYGGGENPFYTPDEDGNVLYNKNERKGGHTLLPNVKPIGSTKEVGNTVVHELPEDAPSIQKRISSVLLNNRFNPRGGDSPFLTNFEKTGGKFGYSVQKDLGVYHSDTANAPDVSVDDLKKIGASLMIRASGHGGPMGFGFESDDPDDVNLMQVFLPSTTQLGLLRPAVVELRAQNAYGAENITKIRAEMLSELNESESDMLGLGGGPANSTSYGNLNSHLEPFGAGTTGMLFQAIGGILALLAFSALVNLIIAGFWWDDDEDDIDLTDMSKGKHMPDGFGGDVAAMFNIPVVDSHFTSCLMYGIMSFCGFAFEPSMSAAQKILDGALNIAMAPGYYAVMFRTILRDVGAITGAVSDLIVELPMAMLFGGIQAVFGVVAKITNSATWRFLMVMVRLGNVILYSRHGHPRLYDPDVDELPEGPRTRVMKSKVGVTSATTLGGGTTAVTAHSLAWRHSANVSRYVLPKSLQNSLADMGISPGSVSDHIKLSLAGNVAENDGSAAKSDIEGNGNIRQKYEIKGDTSIPGRLSSDYVEYIEDALDSEYMPFYFHDLRTNEIISFHAFLNSLSDSFAPDWKEVSGYGRMDPVKIYNKTTRSISIDFTLVSTSEKDFDRMWWDINKLVSMVYPQWSKGRSRTQGNAGFIQPFSQIPTASPVIRMRFGDVIKSNYSKFNLSRLFGVGTSSFKHEGDKDLTKKRADYAVAASKASQKSKAYRISSETEALDPEAGKSGKKPIVGIAFSAAGSFPEYGYQAGDIIVVKPGVRLRWRDDHGHLSSKKMGNKFRRPFRSQAWKVEIESFHWGKKRYKISRSEKQKWALSNKQPLIGSRRRKVIYHCKMLPPGTDSIPTALQDAKYNYLALWHHEIIGLHKDTTNEKWTASMKEQKQETIPTGTEAKGADKLTKTAEFFTAKDNFIVKAFESTRGRGLAGVITSLSFDWGESTWEITPGRRAPQWLKISIGFSPIHDLPLGIDYDGMLRAPAYNVGEIVTALGQDPYDEGTGQSARDLYYNTVGKDLEGIEEPIEDKDAGE